MNDLNDIRKSLDEQGWVPRPGKGSHAVWYPPDRTKRPVSVPMNGKRATKGRAMDNLRTTLRQSGWIDPDVVNRTPLPPRDAPSTDTTDKTGSETTPVASTDPESATMPTNDDTELVVVEEEWARNPSTGKVSSSIKMQLMSDESVRFRCAHQRGAGCTFTSDKLLGVRAHSQVHRIPTLPVTPKLASTAVRRTTGTRRVKDPNKPPTPSELAARERTDRGKVAAARQAQDALEQARASGKVVREYAILPHGLGAGNVTKTVWLVAYPHGKVVFECATAGCGYERDTFGSVFAHRSQAHPRTGPARTDRAAAPKPAADVDDVRPIVAVAAEVPTPSTAAALVRSLLTQEAVASTAIDHDPRAETISIPGVAMVFESQPDEGGDEEEYADEASALEVPVAAGVNGAVFAAATGGGSVAVPVAPEAAGSPYREAVQYVRERMADIVDHLGTIAAGEYDHLAVAEQREAEIARLQARIEASRAQCVSQQEELDKLRGERSGLLEAQAQLDQLRGVFQKLGLG